MTDTDRVIRLVRKLLAKANGAGTTPEESAAFAAKANQLLLQHKLSLSTVQLREEDEEEPIGKKHISNRDVRNRAKWLEELAETVAHTHFCRLIYHPPYSLYTFVGKTSDRELAGFLFETLAKTAYKQGKTWANRMAREHQQRGERVPYRMLAGYLEGFVLAISSRLWENYYATRKQGGKYAVTVFNSQRDRVNAWYAEHGPKESIDDDDLKQQYADFGAMAAGVKAGKAASLHGGLKPPDATGKPTISAARRQLGKGE